MTAEAWYDTTIRAQQAQVEALLKQQATLNRQTQKIATLINQQVAASFNGGFDHDLAPVPHYPLSRRAKVCIAVASVAAAVGVGVAVWRWLG